VAPGRARTPCDQLIVDDVAQPPLAAEPKAASNSSYAGRGRKPGWEVSISSGRTVMGGQARAGGFREHAQTA